MATVNPIRTRRTSRRVGAPRARVAPVERPLSGWADQLGRPDIEARRSRLGARFGGLVALAALMSYLSWRLLDTIPPHGWDRVAAYVLVTFEALPIFGIVLKLVTVWNIDSPAPPPVGDGAPVPRVAVLIPTYNEPVEVLVPTVTAACALQPAHETWVLDDGDRDWVRAMCADLGARYVAREEHSHAKAGNLNNALALMAAEQAADPDGLGIEIIAVLDCDHVPLPSFLTATLGWFVDERIAIVQGPQAFYNSGAFDDDGVTGEQGLFFNVMMPARHYAGAGPFWCGSTSLLRVAALAEVGGVATETITEDMHTTLKLIRRGWRTVYHHQTLAVGLAPATPQQYLVQRRRWGMGAMQVLMHERLWAAKRWMSWRNFQEYLTGTLWWLEGVATLIAFAVPAAVLLSGAQTSTAGPLAFATAFTLMFSLRMWGAKRLLRKQIHWPTAFALRILRIPVGLACLWWLVTRTHLRFEVTPKAGAGGRSRGRVPLVVVAVLCATVAIIGYSTAGLTGAVAWHTSAGSTLASGAWLLLALVVLGMGMRRIRSAQFATSRRNAHRFGLNTPVTVDGCTCELLDISVGGAAVSWAKVPPQPGDVVSVALPGVEPIRMTVVSVAESSTGRHSSKVSLAARADDWAAWRVVSLWMFHTPAGAVEGLPAGVPLVAVRS